MERWDLGDQRKAARECADIAHEFLEVLRKKTDRPENGNIEVYCFGLEACCITLGALISSGANEDEDSLRALIDHVRYCVEKYAVRMAGADTDVLSRARNVER